MLLFSVAHVRFVSVDCRISFSEVACIYLRLAQICRAPVFVMAQVLRLNANV